MGIKLAKDQKPLNIKWSRKFSGQPTSLTLSQDASGRYFVSFVVKEEIKPLPIKKKVVGIDIGLKCFIKNNQGEAVIPPQFLKKEQKRLKRKQKQLAHKQKGSENRKKARISLARLHGKIRDKRNDFLHKLSWQLINENQVIATETLEVKKMQKNRRLAQGISDGGWSTFLRYLEYKSAWYGRDYIQVSPYFPSSKTCSNCGHIEEEMPLSQRMWCCPSCNLEHDRDTNAARNILQEGERLLREIVPRGSRDLKPVEFVEDLPVNTRRHRTAKQEPGLRESGISFL